MAKRFTDTEIWKKQRWFKLLSPEYKLVFLYIKDQCDHAGIWPIDVVQLNEDTGINNFDIDTFISACNADNDKRTGKLISRERIKILNEDVIWLTGFIQFQYQGKDRLVNPSIPVVKSSLNILKGYISLKEPLLKGWLRLKDKDKDKDKDNISNSIKEEINKEENENISGPVIFSEFESLKTELNNSQTWLTDIAIRFKCPSVTTVQKALENWLADQKLKNGLNRPLDDIRSHFINTLNKKPELLKVNGSGYKVPKKENAVSIPEPKKSVAEKELIMWDIIRDYWDKFRSDLDLDGKPKPKNFLTYASFDFLVHKKILTIDHVDLIDLEKYIDQAESRVKVDYKRSSKDEKLTNYPKNTKWKIKMLNDFIAFKPENKYHKQIHERVKQNILWRWFEKLFNEGKDFTKVLPKPKKQLEHVTI